MTDNDETISANAEGVDIEVSKEKLKALLEAAEKSGKGIHPDQVRALLGEQQASIPSIRISVRLDENELYHVDYPIILEKDISPAGVQTMWPRMAQEASPAGVQTMWPRAPQEASPAGVQTMWPRMTQEASPSPQQFVWNGYNWVLCT